MKSHAALTLIAGCFAVSAAALTTTEFYRINSGSYAKIGGSIGAVTNQLPDAAQTYLELIFDHDAAAARMRILGEDGYTQFDQMTDGRIVGGQILFSNLVKHPWHPTVTNEAVQQYHVQLGDASVWVDGSVRSEETCCSAPHTFLHEDVHATILGGPPTRPSGIYDYRGYDQQGSLVVTGVLAVTTITNPIRGTWHWGAVETTNPIGLQIGRGILQGTRNGWGLTLDLNPGMADDHVFLTGVLADSRYTGSWRHSTLSGTAAGGTFQAEKRPVLLLAKPGSAGRVDIACTLAAGMVCAVEFTDACRQSEWAELTRFTTSGEPVSVQDALLPDHERFYRIHILDATGIQLILNCARSLLATHLGAPAETVEIVGIKGVDFLDDCCECGPPGMSCAQVISPGYRLFWRVGTDDYEIRTCGGPMFLCESGVGLVLGECRQTASPGQDVIPAPRQREN